MQTILYLSRGPREFLNPTYDRDMDAAEGSCFLYWMAKIAEGGLCPGGEQGRCEGQGIACWLLGEQGGDWAKRILDRVTLSEGEPCNVFWAVVRLGGAI